MAVRHDPDTDMYTAVNSIDSDQDEIEADIKPGHFTSSKRQTFKRKLFPDSGASICLGGTHHLEELNISPQELIPCNKKIAVVGGGTLPCRGYINVEFVVNNVATQQRLYICDKVDRIFFSKAACIATFILPPLFP